jgi:stringent starvation protein B
MFKARFAGKEHLVSIPYGLIIEIYDRDNPSTGIIFNTVEGIHIERRNMMKQPVPNKQKPSLRIVK